MADYPRLGGWISSASAPAHLDAIINDKLVLNDASILAAKTPQIDLTEHDGVLTLTTLCSPIEDQSRAGACVSNAIVGSLEFLMIRNGMTYVDISRFFNYYNARLMSQDQDKDIGTYISIGISSLTDLGSCAESSWPYDISMVYTRPTMMAYREAYANKVDGAFRIDDIDANERIIASLTMLHTVVFGMTVDRAYQEHVGYEPVAMPKSTRVNTGGHAQLIVGYDRNRKLWLVRNSWGTEWACKGYAWVPWQYLEVSGASDYYVPTLTPDIGGK